MIKRKLKYLRWLIIASIVSTIIGAVIDLKGFTVGIFSGLLGSVIGIWVTVDIIEAILEKQRAREWQQVRDVVLRNLILQLVETANEFLSLVPTVSPYVSLLNDASIINHDKIEALKKLHATISCLDLSLVKKDRIISVYNGVQTHTDILRNMQIYQLLVPGGATKLIELLHELENVQIQWREAMLFNNVSGIAKEELFKRGLITLDSIRELLEYIANN